MSKRIRRDCGDYVRILVDVNRYLGDAKAFGWYARMERSPISAKIESEKLKVATRYFDMLKDIVPKDIIDAFTKSAIIKNYEGMTAMLEAATFYVALFCQGKLKART